MSNMNLPSVPQVGMPPPFRAVLRPYRSLSPTGFVVLMTFVGMVGFIAGVAFLLIGAWPVFGFFGLDVALIYLAFRLNYRSGRRYETIEIDGARLTLTSVDPSGRPQSIEMNPYWANVRLNRAADGTTSVVLASHGREVPFGQFLTDDERIEFAEVLQGALMAARGRGMGLTHDMCCARQESGRTSKGERHSLALRR